MLNLVPRDRAELVVVLAIRLPVGSAHLPKLIVDSLLPSGYRLVHHDSTRILVDYFIVAWHSFAAYNGKCCIFEKLQTNFGEVPEWSSQESRNS